MNMESLGQNGGIEGLMSAFIDNHPEYKEKNFTREEIHQAAELIKNRDASSVQEMLQRALDARVAVRGVKEKMPVINNRDAVIGIGSTLEEARAMYRKDNETRDSI